MTQIMIPDGFELIYFSWDQQAPMTGGAGAFMKAGLALSSGAFAAAVPRPAERGPIEEDVERWDGLS
ncbi:MAG TPA: hypothetical protein VFC46_02510 [Humisphaera sp.]|nr:hypothetical protein [Humisphaera sp.]